MKPLFGNRKSVISILGILIFVLGINVTGYALPVSQRTPQVRNAIVAAVPGVNHAAGVTPAHLAAITELDLSGLDMPALKSGDFDGLTALTNLNLFDNDLTSLPEDVFAGLSSLTTLTLERNWLTALPLGIFDDLTALTNLDLSNLNNLVFGEFTTLRVGVFDGLTALTTLNLQGNDFSTLPAGVFDGLTALTELWLNANQLTALPADVFDGLSALTQLYLDNNQLTTLSSDIFDEVSGLTSLLLNNNQLTSLPADVFDGLSALSILHLHNNQLSTVSAGVFEGLAALTQLLLSGNSVDPIPLNVSLEQVAEGKLKAAAPVGAPFDIVLPLTVTNGSIGGGASSITISKGTVESGTLSVTRTTGTTAAVTANIGTLPGIPTSHRGYALVKSTTDLPLTVIPAVANNAPVFTDGTSTTRSIAENTASGEHIGTAITATDADSGDTLTYTLGGTDAAAFEIDATTGQLKTKAALDYETKTTYTVTVTVSDGSLTGTITVTINITDVNELLASTGVCKVGDVLAPGQSCTYPGTDAVFSVLGDGTAQWHIPNLPAGFEWINQISVSGSLRVSTTVNGQAYHFVAEQVGTSWEIKEIGDDRSDPQPETPEVPEPPTVTEKPIESNYDHIEGPWLWMIAPGGDIDMDNLSEASEGVITEPQIAQNGVNEGDHFDTLQWTSGRLLPTTVCGIFLCSSDNVINVVRKIGLTDSAQLNWYSAYALINISSPHDQNDVLMGVGSDDSIKVWLNGSIVYKNDVTRRTTGIQNQFPVNLNAGDNLLLIKVCNHGALWSNNDWGMFFKLYLDTQDYTVSLPMGDGNSWQPVTPAEDTPVPTPNTRIAFEANTPAGYTRVALTDTGRVWGIPTKYTTDSDVGTVAYMALAKLMGCNFANAEVARQSVVYIKRQTLGTLSGFVSETVCGKASGAWSTDWNGVQITHLRFFDETSLPNVKEAVYNTATDEIEIPGVWQQPPNNTTVEGDSSFFWTDDDTDKIQRANLDGSNVQILVRGLGVPYGIALDVVGGKMYWTDIGTDKIQRANLDGSNIEDLVTQGLRAPSYLALDVAGGKMYWTDWGTDKIQRANLYHF